MKAILIDPSNQTVEEINIGKDYREIYGVIGNDCTTFTTPILEPNGDTWFADDEGLFHENIGAVIRQDWVTPIVGRIVVLGSDESGESTDVKSSVEHIRKGLRFIPKDNPVLINYFNEF